MEKSDFFCKFATHFKKIVGNYFQQKLVPNKYG